MTTATFEPGKLDIGRVFSQTFAVLRRNFVAFFGLSFLLTGLPTGIMAFVQAGRLPKVSTDPLAAFSPAMIVPTLLAVLVVVVAVSVLQGALIHGTVQDMNGNRPSLGDCLATGLRSFLPLLAVSILFSLALAGATILLIVPGIMLGCAWCVVVPALVADRTTIRGAFGRASDLTRGNRWRIFGLFLIFWVALFVFAMIAGALIVGAALGTGGFDPVSFATSPLQIGLQTLINAVSYAISSTGVAVLYVELRRAREGLGAEGLAGIFS